MSVGQKLLIARDTLTHLGPRWVAYRVKLACEQRLGRLARKLPGSSWDQIRYSVSPNNGAPCDFLAQRRKASTQFFFSPSDFAGWKETLASFDATSQSAISCVSSALAIRQGKFELFSHFTRDLGYPPKWNFNFVSQETLDNQIHFSRISDFAEGDIKAVWELSRFPFAFTLARAFARTGDEQHAETFWQLFEDWCRENPPQTGPNWKCGQETSLRLMAWLFAFHAFLGSSATTPARAELFAKALHASGERISRHLDYALSQQNNHAISEAAGLFILGLLFPDFRDAAEWKATGRRHLESLGRELFYDDGAFAQHSFNYERLALHVYLWAIRLADLNGEPFSSELRARICKAARFVFQFQDDRSGSLPNYGHNDGALVLPLTECDYSDFRPLLQSFRYLDSQDLQEPSGPWDEETLWLFGADALSAPRARKERSFFSATKSGYFAFRGENSFGFIRCPKSFLHRPGQADLLHFDLWFAGRNIAADPGTYSYNAPEPWDNALEKSIYHNLVTFDARDQMQKVSRFLWLPWARGEVHSSSEAEGFSYFEAEHFGYAPAVHRRGILRCPGDFWIVIDFASTSTPREIALHWLFPDARAIWDQAEARLDFSPTAEPYYFHFVSVLTQTPPAISLVTADSNSPRGWISRYYLSREPALSFNATVRANRAQFISVFSPEPAHLTLDATRLNIISATRSYAVDLQSPDHVSLMVKNVADSNSTRSWQPSAAR